MLQQTTVAAVQPRFERFVARWPTIEELAAARDAEVLSEWAGLGYYARARNLIACAREITRRGSFPATAAELRDLPGIGEYTAGAGDFTQAMMDLGATVCRPKAPLCSSCPLRAYCVACRSGDPEAFPAAKPRRARPHKYGLAYWTERDGHVWLVRRPAKGLLGGMAALPGSEWTGAPLCDVNPIGTVRHVFTHFSLDLQVVLSSDMSGDGWWHPVAEIGRAGLPTLYRKAADLALATEERDAA
jgi:A/G-specific adenine glycosylase